MSNKPNKAKAAKTNITKITATPAHHTGKTNKTHKTGPENPDKQEKQNNQTDQKLQKAPAPSQPNVQPSEATDQSAAEQTVKAAPTEGQSNVTEDIEITETEVTEVEPAETKTTEAKPAEPVKNDPKPAESNASKRAAKKLARKSADASRPEKPLKQVFILARPFVALGRYLRDSWRELRQVRWPNRKVTWKMTLAVLIYCAIFIAFIVLLDTFFTFIFNLLLA